MFVTCLSQKCLFHEKDPQRGQFSTLRNEFITIEFQALETARPVTVGSSWGFHILYPGGRPALGATREPRPPTFLQIASCSSQGPD